MVSLSQLYVVVVLVSLVRCVVRAQTQTFKGAGTGPSQSLWLHRRIDSKKKNTDSYNYTIKLLKR